MKSAIVVYVPVIHSGYLNFIDKHKNIDVFVVGETLIKDLDPVLAQKLPRQLNAIRSTDAVFCLKEIAIFSENINIMTNIKDIDEYDEIIMPVSDITKLIAERIPNKKIVWDTIFLQYDWSSANIKSEIIPDTIIFEDELSISIMNRAERIATQSSDFWRHVGVVLAKNGKILLGAYNKHLPNDETPYIFGDPRWSFNGGESPEICGAIHGEKNVFALALLNGGISTKGADLFSTVFPCTPCALFIATCGISRLFFKHGYSNIHSEKVLKEAGVQIIRVVQNQIPLLL